MLDASAPRDAELDAPGALDSGNDSGRVSSDGGPLDAGADAVRPDSGYDGPTFTDVTAAAGIDIDQGERIISDDCGLVAVTGCAPQMSGGAAAGDYDGDGWTDLYVTRLDGPDALYRNLGDGTFENRAVDAGLTYNLPSNGAGFGDVDNDGDLDLYVTTIGDYRFYLFINDGKGHFAEEAVVRGAGVQSSYPHSGFSVAFGDYDRDGYLDLYVTEWRPDSLVPSGTPSHNRLLNNRGASEPGYFDDVTESAGVSLDGLEDRGSWGFSPTFSDLDGDGWPDLAIAADFGTSRIFWNDGDGTFSDGTEAAGVGTEENGMGSAIGDFDGDGRLDWFVTSIFCDDADCNLGATGNRLYRNNGDRTFTDHTDEAGVRNGRWGWGTAFFDYDNDSDLDLVMTNGVDFPDPDAAVFRTDRMRLWRNESAAMTELAAPAGLTDRGNGKGLMVLDYDNDGDLDVFIARRAQTPLLYRNDGPSSGSYLRLALRGTSSNRFGIGARVTLTVSGSTDPMVRELRAGSHFLGQSESIVHFGFGAVQGSVQRVRIAWPSGVEQLLEDVAINQTLEVIEP